MFIPFLGAVVTAKSMGDDAAAEARVGLAGPILGTHRDPGAARHLARTGSEFWQALAYVGFFINLFNLLPVLPLDGGRAMAALSPWVWLVGYARPDRAHGRVLQPDPAPDPGLRRLRALPPLEGAQHARVTRLPRRLHPHEGHRRGGLPRAGGRARDRHRRELPAQVALALRDRHRAPVAAAFARGVGGVEALGDDPVETLAASGLAKRLALPRVIGGGAPRRAVELERLEPLAALRVGQLEQALATLVQEVEDDQRRRLVAAAPPDLRVRGARPGGARGAPATGRRPRRAPRRRRRARPARRRARG